VPLSVTASNQEAGNVALESVFVDSREPEYLQSLTFGGAPVAVTMLDAGDYLLMCSDAVLGVERKTCADFANTLRDERLFPQLSRLRELTPWAYLALVGTITPGPQGKAIIDGRESGWQWASLTGALLAVQEIGVHILHVDADSGLESALLRLANRDRSPMRIKPVRDLTVVGEGEAILAGLPGVGADRAAALIQYAGSPAWALQYLTDDSRLNAERIPGIGEGTKRRVRRALGLDDEQHLAVVLKETGNPVEPSPTKQLMEVVA
jgi:ERCC4-type nuclease